MTVGRRRERQVQDPAQSPKFARLGGEPAAMRIHNGRDDGQSESGAATAARTGVVDAVEPVGEMGQIRCGYAGRTVFPPQFGLIVHGRQRTFRRRCIGVSQCVEGFPNTCASRCVAKTRRSVSSRVVTGALVATRRDARQASGRRPSSAMTSLR